MLCTSDDDQNRESPAGGVLRAFERICRRCHAAFTVLDRCRHVTPLPPPRFRPSRPCRAWPWKRACRRSPSIWTSYADPIRVSSRGEIEIERRATHLAFFAGFSSSSSSSDSMVALDFGALLGESRLRGRLRQQREMDIPLGLDVIVIGLGLLLAGSAMRSTREDTTSASSRRRPTSSQACRRSLRLRQ